MDLNESQLIQRVLGGDPAAERALYGAHVDRIYRLAYRMTGDETMAEDFTQDTFIRAFDRLADFQGRSALSTWLHSVAVSVILNGLRKIKRIRTREIDIDEAPARSTAARVPDPDLKLRLHRAIETLTDGLRLVFVMHDVEGYKHEEIARVLEVPVGTSKTRLARARRALRDTLTAGGWRLAEEDGR